MGLLKSALISVPMQNARATLIPGWGTSINIKTMHFVVPLTPTKDRRNANRTDLTGVSRRIAHFQVLLTIAHGIATAAFAASSLIWTLES